MSVEHLKQKQETIDEIKGRLDRATSVVVIDYIGISVTQANELRSRFRAENVDYKVYKNSLVNRGIEGTGYSDMKPVLEGPSAFAIGYGDSTAPARIINGAIKDFKKMEFKAGIVEGVFYDADGIKAVAQLPSREELLAKFLGSIQSPLGKFVRTLAAIADEKSAGGTAPAAETVPEAPVEEAAPAAETAPEAPAEEATPVTEDAAPVSEPAEEKADEPASEE